MARQWEHESVKALFAEKGIPEDGDATHVIKSMARELVLEAYTRGWSGPPFNLVELAAMRGIEVDPSELVIDGRIVPLENGRYRIEYNPFQSEARINFSIAHEIGHTFFPDCRNLIRNREQRPEKDSWELEFLCNVAAAEILLPYALFSSDASQVSMTMDGMLELATKYKASLESVLLRFVDVIESPVTMAIARFNSDHDTLLEVDYSKSTAAAKVALPRGFIIPADSKAYDCKKAGWTAHGIESWPSKVGQKHHVFSVGLGSLRRHQTFRVGLFFYPALQYSSGDHAIRTVSGDATEPRGSGPKIIAQLVNTSAATGFGFGRAMAKKFPKSKEALAKWKTHGKGFALGATQLVELGKDIFVAQMVAQEGVHPKGNAIPLKYGSLVTCLRELAAKAKRMGATVHMPYIGAGQAGGNWEIIKGMIHQELVLNGVDVCIYRLPGKQMLKPSASQDELFT